MSKKIFLDLDGTLARFNVPNALERFKREKDFFFNLLAYKGIEEINELATEEEIYIISASPNVRTDKDKRKWIRVYLPNLKRRNVILCRLGENKANIIEKKLNIKIDNTCFLLDDYTKNLNEWVAAGGVGIKRLTKVADNSTKKWKGLELKDLRKLQKIIKSF